MPSDLIIKTGDQIKITIPPPTVVPSIQAPVPLIGTSKLVTVTMMAACLEGDELPKALVTPQPYTAPPYLTPGTGTLSLKLTPANKSKVAKDSGSAILLKGATFTAEFQVVAPAIDPIKGDPDPVLKKTGTAQFLTTNQSAKAE